VWLEANDVQGYYEDNLLGDTEEACMEEGETASATQVWWTGATSAIGRALTADPRCHHAGPVESAG
jgi:hypothetical protein